ncbi:MAG: Sec-independent protein translocase protein TatB [Pseudomonadota bacterium]
MSLIPQFGFLELMMIAVIALIVVGPKDLPKLMHSVGRFVAKAKRMAAEFGAAFEQMARETEMEELRKEIDTLKNENLLAKTKRDIEDGLKPIENDLRKQNSDLKSAVAKPAGPPSDVSPDAAVAPSVASEEEPAKS